MDNPKEPGYFDKHKKIFYVSLFGILAISVSGYFMGLRQVKRDVKHQTDMNVSHSESHNSDNYDAIPIVGYKELRPSPLRANANWENHLKKLPAPETSTSNDAIYIKGKSILERQKRRAYDGAPPVVPHPIDQNDSASCVACHTKDMSIAGKMVPKMSHEFLTSCTQCHVTTHGIDKKVNSKEFGLLEINLFQGKESSGNGSRAYNGAPPVIPHSTLMRSDCMSCHGPSRPNAIKTSHPDRQSCTQCHAPSAYLDQR